MFPAMEVHNMKTNTAYVELFAAIMLTVDPDELIDSDATLPSDAWLTLMEDRLSDMNPRLELLAA
jgi:hypothetical protein